MTENILVGAGTSIETQYRQERAQQRSRSIQTSGGNTACRSIYFIPCPDLSQNASKWVFRKFVSEAITMANNDSTSRIRSIAFPAIGCGRHNCHFKFVAQTLISAVVYEFEKRASLRLNVHFVIQQDRQGVFNAFDHELEVVKRRQAVGTIDSRPTILAQLPPRVPRKHENPKSFSVEKRSIPPSADEYTQVQQMFQSTMTAQDYKEILRIELIWNRRWYQQYMIHHKEFSLHLGENPQRMLFHGCSEKAANSIVEKYFNRSYAGEHGTYPIFIGDICYLP